MLKSAMQKAKLGREEELQTLKRLDDQARQLERTASGPSFDGLRRCRTEGFAGARRPFGVRLGRRRPGDRPEPAGEMTGPPTAKRPTIGNNMPTPISAILLKPRKASACFVFAHGAGAGMDHPFMEQVAVGLYGRGIATLRYQFPFMEKGSKRPDSPAVAHSAVREAIAEARKRCRGMPLIAGGKSFGGRMTSQAQAIEPLKGVQGLAFLGFPLHPHGKPSITRAEHLSEIRVPMLFVQGTRDKLAEPDLLAPVVRRLGRRATVQLLEQADHGFRVPARSGRADGDVVTEILDAFSAWTAHIA